METKHISMKDHAPPSVPEMRLAADYLSSALSEGKVVLVHCLAGKGRTGSALAAYMMAYEGKTARQALEELRSMRGGSVERAQEPGVLQFEAEALKGRSTKAPGRGTKPQSTP